MAWTSPLHIHLQEFAMTVAISFWVAQIIGNSMGTIAALCLLCHPWACLPASIFLLIQVCRQLTAVERDAVFLIQSLALTWRCLVMQAAIIMLPVGDAPYIVER